MKMQTILATLLWGAATCLLVAETELPAAYRRLDSVRSTGSAFVDTGYTPGSNTRVEMDFELDTARMTGSVIPFGWAGSAEPHYFLFYDTSTWWAYVGSQWKSWAAGAPVVAGRKTLVFNDADGNTTLDGNVLDTRNGAAFTCPDTVYIFARHDPGDAAVCPTPMKLYAFKIYESGALVRDYVPALKRDTRTCGLYETRTGAFLTHADLQPAGLVEVIGSAYGASYPAAGVQENFTTGTSYTFMSQRNWWSLDGAAHALCTGWRFTRLDGTVLTGTGSVMRLVYDDALDFGGRLEWIWTTNAVDELPEGYLAIPLITSTGTQYIDTGVNLDSSMRVDLAFTVNGIISCSPFGSEGASGEYWFLFLNTYNLSWNQYLGTEANCKWISVPAGQVGGFHSVRLNDSGRLYVDGAWSGASTLGVTAPCSAYIFARHDVSSGDKPNCFANMDLHSLDIYDANGLVRAYVPALRMADNVLGLYDLVENTFVTNAGTGTFGPAGFIRVKDGEGRVRSQTVAVDYLVLTAPRSVDAQGRTRICTGWRLTRLNGEVVADVTDEFVYHYSAADCGALLEWFYRDAAEDELPTGYVRLESIRTDGSGAYIDTGLVPDETLNIRLRFRNDPSPVGATTIPFGVECEAGRYCFLYPHTGADRNWWLFWENDIIKTGTAAPPLYGHHDFRINTLDHVSVLDGYGAGGKCQGTFTAADTAYLFARNDSGTAKWFTPMDLYGCTLRTNGVVARAFVPVQRVSDFTSGLYDTVEGRFYANAGTGAFWPNGGIVWVDGTLVDGRMEGQVYTYSAPTAARDASASVHRVCRGWRLTRRDGSVLEGEGGTASWTFAAADNGGRLEWLWREVGRASEIRRSRLTFAATAVTGHAALTNFPVLVRLSPARVPGFAYEQCAADGSDIRFSASPTGGNVLPCEVDTWNPQGESTFWVRVPVVDNGGAFYLFWGDGVAQTRVPSEVWTDYAGVWHFGACVENAFADSVANGHALTLKPSENPVTVTTDATVAQVGSAKAGTGSLLLADYLSIVAAARNDGKKTDYSLSGWFHAPTLLRADLLDWYYPFSAHSGSGHPGWYLEAYAAAYLKFRSQLVENNYAFCTTVPDYRSEWMHLAVVAEEGHAKVAINGVWIPGYVFSTSLLTEEGVALELPKDHLDELRLSAQPFSDAWMGAEYRQVADPDFLGAEAAVLLEKLPTGTVILVR